MLALCVPFLPKAALALTGPASLAVNWVVTIALLWLP